MSSLLLLKRVSPISGQTIPRLELTVGTAACKVDGECSEQSGTEVDISSTNLLHRL